MPYYTLITYMVIVPQPVNSFLNIAQPFSALVWAGVVLAVLAVGLAAWQAYRVYERLGDTVEPHLMYGRLTMCNSGVRSIFQLFFLVHHTPQQTSSSSLWACW